MTLRIVLMALALPALLGAQSARFNVPFPFVGFDSDFPPGPYAIARIGDGNALLLTDLNRGETKLLAALNHGLSRNGVDTLMFERHGGYYILREYRSATQGVVKSLPLSKQRREVVKRYVARGLRPEPILISAVQ